MERLPAVSQWVLRITGLIQLILGLIIWTGAADGLIPLHILDGLLFVLALLALAWLMWRSAGPAWLAWLAVVWAIVLPVVGLTQERLLPGGAHILIQVVHLLLGLGAIGLGEQLARRLRAVPARVVSR